MKNLRLLTSIILNIDVKIGDLNKNFGFIENSENNKSTI